MASARNVFGPVAISASTGAMQYQRCSISVCANLRASTVNRHEIDWRERASLQVDIELLWCQNALHLYCQTRYVDIKRKIQLNETDSWTSCDGSNAP